MKKTRINRISDKRKLQLVQEQELRIKLFEQQGGRCAICGRTCDWRGWSLHHTIFRSHGGESNEDNCVLVCGKCHASSHGIKEIE